MPKSRNRKPKVPSLAQSLRKELRDKRKALGRQLSRVNRDLNSLGVKHVKRKTKR